MLLQPNDAINRWVWIQPHPPGILTRVKLGATARGRGITFPTWVHLPYHRMNPRDPLSPLDIILDTMCFCTSARAVISDFSPRKSETNTHHDQGLCAAHLLSPFPDFVSDDMCSARKHSTVEDALQSDSAPNSGSSWFATTRCP